MKSLNKIKLDPTSSNIMQQYPTWCSNGPNMLDTTMLDDVGPTCCIRLNRPLVLNALNKRRIDEKKCGVYSRAAFNNIFACSCGVISRTALIPFALYKRKFPYKSTSIYALSQCNIDKHVQGFPPNYYDVKLRLILDSIFDTFLCNVLTAI